MQQLRIIAGNAAQLTGMTHEYILHRLQRPSPAKLFLRTVQSLIDMMEKRQQTLLHNDISRDSNWTHLYDIQLWLTQVMDAPPTLQAIPTEEQPLACPFCDKTFPTSRGLSQHLKVVHDHVDKGRRLAVFHADSTDGLPTCSVCGLKMPSWKRFIDHVATHRSSPQEHVSAEVWLRRWLETSLGSRASTYLQQRDWEGLKQDRELCAWLSKYCVLCGSWTGSIQKSNAHLRQHHVKEMHDVFVQAGK